jgi:hypothetical protein
MYLIYITLHSCLSHSMNVKYINLWWRESSLLFIEENRCHGNHEVTYLLHYYKTVTSYTIYITVFTVSSIITVYTSMQKFLLVTMDTIEWYVTSHTIYLTISLYQLYTCIHYSEKVCVLPQYNVNISITSRIICSLLLWLQQENITTRKFQYQIKKEKKKRRRGKAMCRQLFQVNSIW